MFTSIRFRKKIGKQLMPVSCGTGADFIAGQVAITMFSQANDETFNSVQRIQMTPSEARNLARQLIEHAEKIEQKAL